MEFRGFGKIARWSRDIVITEKIDGTNAQILITPIQTGYSDELMLGWWYASDASVWAMYAGSRTRWITPANDNYGFATWAKANFDELKNLGPGQHFGEWWGQGIQRKYGMGKKVFSLFNTAKWGSERPSCCEVVPVLWVGPNEQRFVDSCLADLRVGGSHAAPGFMNPEGIVLYHSASGHLFKKTLEDDEKPKGQMTEDHNIGHA
jgi:hypothetical protein